MSGFKAARLPASSTTLHVLKPSHTMPPAPPSAGPTALPLRNIVDLSWCTLYKCKYVIPLSSSSVSRPEAGSGFASSAPSGVVSGQPRGMAAWARSSRVLVLCGRPQPASCSRTNCPWRTAGREERGGHGCFSVVDNVPFHWGFQKNRGLTLLSSVSGKHLP